MAGEDGGASRSAPGAARDQECCRPKVEEERMAGEARVKGRAERRVVACDCGFVDYVIRSAGGGHSPGAAPVAGLGVTSAVKGERAQQRLARSIAMDEVQRAFLLSGEAVEGGCAVMQMVQSLAGSRDGGDFEGRAPRRLYMEQ